MMLSIGKTAYYRDGGLGCLGTYRSISIAFGPVYLCFAWRIREKPVSGRTRALGAGSEPIEFSVDNESTAPVLHADIMRHFHDAEYR